MATAQTKAPAAKPKAAKLDKAAQSARSKKKAAASRVRSAATGKSCQVEGCKRPYRSKSLCVTHYGVWRRGGSKLPKQRYRTCSKEECKKPTVRWGLCDEHFKAASKKGQAASA